MATLRLEIAGDLGAITLKAFMDAIAANVRMLRDYDRGLSVEAGAPGGTLDWVIANVAAGSLLMDVRSKSRVAGLDVGLSVVRAHVEGWQRIEREGATPPYLTEEAMRQARRVAKMIGRDGVSGFAVAEVNGHVEERAEVSPKAAVNLDQLLWVKRRALGSVEGTIETISIHGGKRFVIYHSRTKKAITCTMIDDRWLKRAAEVLGRRVIVRGTVYSNGKGEPLRIEVGGIRVLRERHELPDTASLTGIDPDFTGGESTEAYLRRMRGA